MKIGVFGGLFDPPHIGHLIIAQHVLDEFHLQGVIFVPAGNPPHKAGYSPYETRYAMTALAIEGNDRFAISDVERTFADKTYTVEIIKILRRDIEDELHLMIGSDQWQEIETWKDPDELFRECRVVVVRRPNYNVVEGSKFYDRITVSDAPLIDISSTMVRARIRRGVSVRYLVLPAVHEYITKNNVYRS
ncbi:nicotinate (nicotinamide) nucleotide adenylyltransferase [candidate division WOR-3 bacterium]|nr:nicotinate (nicotinamide) nucleotide adenylyltransferase [candidate division WOR-3 bacterium]